MEQENKSLAQIKELKKNYISAFSGRGEKVLEDLEKKCFINKSTFPADGNDLKLAFNEGMRFVVVSIKNMINMDIKTLDELSKLRGDEEDV